MPPAIFEQDGTVDFHYFSGALNATYFSTLFKKPIIYTTSIIADANDESFGRVKASLGFTLMLKRTKHTTIGIGAIGFIDKIAQIPALPVFLYNHKFKNPKWELDVILPLSVFLRKYLGENGRLSLGSTFGSSGFYVNSNNQSLNDLLEYRQLEIKTGLMYEHRINNFITGTVQGGMQNVLNSRLTEKGESASNNIYENTQDPAAYFKIGLSIDPFAKKKSN